MKQRDRSQISRKIARALSAIMLFLFIIIAFEALRGCSVAEKNWMARPRLGLALWRNDWATVVKCLAAPTDPCGREHLSITYTAELAAEGLIAAGPTAVPAVVENGIDSEDPQVRYMSMRVLGRIGDKTVIPKILSTLSHERYCPVLVFGAEALYRLGDPKDARPYLEMAISGNLLRRPPEFLVPMSAMVSGQSGYVRENRTPVCAIRKAYRLAEQYSINTFPLEREVQSTRKAYADLNKASSERDWQTLVTLLGMDAEITRGPEISGIPYQTTIAEIAADRLAAAGPDGVVAVTKLGLNSHDYKLRAMAMRVLGRFGDQKYIPLILSRLSEESSAKVLVLGAEALCRLGRSEKARPFLVKVLDSNSNEIPNDLICDDFAERARVCGAHQKAQDLLEEYGL